MKVAIIGGGGLVGSCAGFALQAGRIVREIALVDVNRELAEGQALDLMHGSSLVADQAITGGGTEQVADADMVVITAGLRRKPDESRLDLINRNVELFRKILADLKRHGLRKGRDGVRRLQSGRRADVPGGEGVAAGAAASLRSGNDARHDAAAWHSGAAIERAADAGLGDDAGRARRQHGGHLVGRADRRPAARQVAGRHARR